MPKDPSLAWTQLIGSLQRDYPTSVSTAVDGSVYISGWTEGNLDGETNNGDDDAFLIKFKSDGSKAWTQLIGTTARDSAESVSTAADGSVYVAGFTYGNLDGITNSGASDAFLSKYNSDGTREWTQIIATTRDDSAASVSVSLDGSVYVAGSTSGDLDGEYRVNSDAFLIKYSSKGVKEWTQLIGVIGNGYATSVSTDVDGSVYILGQTPNDLDGQTNNGETDVFLTKFTSDGSKEWTRLIGSSSWDNGYSVSTSDDGSVYVSGGTQGALDGQRQQFGDDAFLIKYNSNGSKEWTQVFGTNSSDIGYSVSTADDGSIYVGGETGGDLDGQTNSGYGDAFLIKYNSNGTKEWTQLIGSPWGERATSVSPAGDGSIYVAGSTGGNLNSQINNGLSDIFIAKYSINDSTSDTKLIANINSVSTQKKVQTFKIEKALDISGRSIDGVIVGTKKKDKITGTSDGEVLAGMKGKDVLKGGKGADGFLFNQPSGFGNKHADQIKDFDSGEGDSILLENDVFSLGEVISIKAASKKNKVKKAAKSKNDFVYDEKKGLLYFNENGKEKGWGDGGLFVKLQGAPELGADDFTIV